MNSGITVSGCPEVFEPERKEGTDSRPGFRDAGAVRTLDCAMPEDGEPADLPRYAGVMPGAENFALLLFPISPVAMSVTTTSSGASLLDTVPHMMSTSGEVISLMPVLAAYGGYDVKSMSDETIVEFANEILGQLKLVSYKYR